MRDCFNTTWKSGSFSEKLINIIIRTLFIYINLLSILILYIYGF